MFGPTILLDPKFCWTKKDVDPQICWITNVVCKTNGKLKFGSAQLSLLFCFSNGENSEGLFVE